MEKALGVLNESANSSSSSASTDEQCRALAERIFRAKEERRRELARLPFEEKFRILLELQRIAYEFRTAAGLPARKPRDIPR